MQKKAIEEQIKEVEKEIKTKKEELRKLIAIRRNLKTAAKMMTREENEPTENM